MLLNLYVLFARHGVIEMSKYKLFEPRMCPKEVQEVSCLLPVCGEQRSNSTAVTFADGRIIAFPVTLVGVENLLPTSKRGSFCFGLPGRVAATASFSAQSRDGQEHYVCDDPNDRRKADELCHNLLSGK